MMQGLENKNKSSKLVCTSGQITLCEVVYSVNFCVFRDLTHRLMDTLFKTIIYL